VTTKRLSAEQRKKQILMSAISVFAEDTYHGATTKRISEEAGITEALIYRYFGSKRNLFTEAIHQTSGRLIKGIEKHLEHHKDNPLRAITECFTYYVSVLRKHDELAKMIFLVISELDKDDVREAYLPYQEEGLKTVGRALEYWSQQGYLVDDSLDVKTATWLFYGTYIILALVKHSHGNAPLDATPAIELATPFFKPDLVAGWKAELLAEAG
jgi:AcrR family transcriptional regulator